MRATLHYISKRKFLKYLSLSQRTNFCLKEPGTHTEIRLLWRREGVHKNTNGGGGGGAREANDDDEKNDTRLKGKMRR
jgi:hypothetical protein